ncbi:hypothetical protein RO3G_17370 [Rhizopus delemar RA 99-880]|uniref:Retrotransposon gag domain-containing protein n=1 Tax=Rhizopus delemar (strain RA 99-880 / ATCC MYA-4621 / FGSC 9543 / NRRL 43880) TaxID=246409 RepID=I1CW29_RHIO9|nr:hypothetical protein RO3G_17370 [Rhizopus delemar RA 99-880]|eukprot:EIE92659.1 hypothetical protein RO3G_17370 [Rhizopus delemar RA 99-880]
MNSTTGENSFNSGAAPNGDNMSMATGSIDLSSFAGSSPLTDDGTAMVLDSFLVPSSSTGEREELLLRQNLTQLRSEFNGFLEAFTTARLAGDEAAADHALQQMDRTKRRLTAMQEYSSILGKTASPNASISSRNAGLTLSHRDLPKFQLASSVVRPFPNEEVFESVEHFLARFENIIKGSAYRDVEQVWKQFLALCLPYSDNAWVETDLRKCNTWAEARAAFKEHHGSSLATRHYTDLVFTMQMSNKESIGDYSKKFLQAVYNAGLPSDDPRIADRFLASLTLSVQTLIRVTVARVGKSKADTNEKWTVEYITQVGRDILGDDNKLYAEATALIPGANKSDTVKSRYNENGSRGDGSLSGHRRHQFKRRSHNMTKVNKNYFCTHHGKNGTHDTVDCFTTKRVEKVNTNKKCFKCGQPWSREHKCKNNDKKVFAVTSRKDDNDPDDDVVKDKTALLDQATSERTKSSWVLLTLEAIQALLI